MNKPDDFDWLDKALSGDMNHIDDNGFTNNVVQRLPPCKPRRRWLREATLSVAVLLSGGIVLWSLPDQAMLYTRLTDFVYSQSLITLGFLSASLCITAGVVTAWLLNLDN